jgi:hypothetical protein
MSGAIPPLPHYAFRNNFTFTFERREQFYLTVNIFPPALHMNVFHMSSY